MSARALFLLSTLILSSCASYKRHYSKAVKNWNQNTPSPDLKLLHTMYLVGDAGNASEGKVPVLDYLKTQLASESKNSSVFFLGDNIYEYGMPPKEDKDDREAAEFNITAQLKILDDYKGRPVFLPGNHDWRGWGLKGLKREEKFVEGYLNKRDGKTDEDEWENYFLPDDGCSGPEAVELSGDVVVLVVDSQWWLADWDKEPKINEGCEARNRATFRFIFENMVRKYKNKNLVIALHHPPYTYGPHGGGFTPKQHLFPLTDINPKLYIPLPGIGTLEALIRSSIGSRQDVPNQSYRELRSALLAGAKKNGSFIFVSGHEHTLQYIENENQKFIVSGSGSKESPVRLGKGSEFATGKMGYSTLQFYEGGETWAQFYEVHSDGKSADLVYQKRIKEKSNAIDERSSLDFSEYEKHEQVSTKPITTTKVNPVGNGHEFLFGAHHRNIYLEKYDFPVFDAATFQSGVTPLKQGGGNQTNSLRIRAGDGKDYVLRGMTKDASRFLPFPFNKMVAAKYLVEDHFLSTHPFAPLAVPTLADAINVYHTNPKIYYVPVQPALGAYNDLFGGALALVEERPSGKNWKDTPSFGSPDNIIGTPDVVENLLKNNNHQVDEEWALRSRLLDFLIGDWDRHDDQWTWARFDQDNNKKLYRPIPRDRDQAFSRYDGLITGLANQTLPFLRQLQSFGPEIKSTKWTTWSARLFDRTFLNELDWAQWENQVKLVQQQLTDDVIERAFGSWPEKAKKLSAPFIISGLKQRRNDLMKIAREHFEFISQSVNVIGTDERERFIVDRSGDHTKVTMYELSKKGDVKEKVYERMFSGDVTHVINLYGNGDDDEFIIRGNSASGIKVRLIGGLGKDLFADSSFVKSGGKKTIVYDDLTKNEIIPGRETKDKRTNLYSYNIYDRRGYDSEYDILLPLPILGYNPDDGALVGGQLTFINYSFKKEPYASNQMVSGSYAFQTNAFRLNYRGDFLSVFRKSDFYIDTRYHGPTYAFNFANLGNETVRSVDNANYYRVRQQSFRIYPAFKKRFAHNSGWITLGPTFETTKIENTAARFISSYGSTEDPQIFEQKNFAGAEFGLYYNNVDNYYAPHRGIRFQSTLNWVNNLKNEKTFTAWRASLSFYKHLDTKENFILASQIGGGQNLGSGYEFFQLPTIGGNLGLRGYRNERFYGQNVFWHSTDLRIRLLSSYNPTLPITIGLTGSFDYGRAWLKGEDSDKWHNSIGGGLWFAPVDALIFSFGTFFPSEDYEESPRFVFRLGFGF